VNRHVVMPAKPLKDQAKQGAILRAFSSKDFFLLESLIRLGAGWIFISLSNLFTA
jgi:hypothetical protein